MAKKSHPKEEPAYRFLIKDITTHKKDSQPYGLKNEKVKVINDKDYYPVIIVEGIKGRFSVNNNDLR